MYEDAIKVVNVNIKKNRLLLGRSRLIKPTNAENVETLKELKKIQDSLIKQKALLRRENESLLILNVMSQNKKVLSELESDQLIKKIVKTNYTERTIADVIKDFS
jgi:hypothetical protein